MIRKISVFMFFLSSAITLSITSCSSSDDGDNDTETGQTTLEDLKALFDKGDITHIDFATAQNRVLLDEEIESMTIVSGDAAAFGLEGLKIITMSLPLSENTPDALRERHETSLTFSEEAEPIVIDDKFTGFWSEVVISISGNSLDDFNPRAYLIDSEINTASLVLLEDKLRMKFKKK